MSFAKRKIFVLVVSVAGVLLLWRVLAAIDFMALAAALGTLSFWQIAAIVSFPFISFTVAAIRLGVMFRMLGAPRVPFAILLRATFAGASISMIAPSASVTGDVAKSILLARETGDRARTFASVAMDSFGRFIANAGMSFLLVLAVVLAYPALLGGTGRPVVTVIGVLAAALALIFFIQRFFRRSGRIVKLVERFIPDHGENSTLHEFDAMVTASLRTFRAPFASFLISVVGFGWELGQAWLFLRFLGADVSFPALLLWYAVVTFPRMLPAPGGLGFVEVAGIVAAEFFGVPSAFGFGFVLLGRLRDLVILSVGAAALLSVRSRPTPAQ